MRSYLRAISCALAAICSAGGSLADDIAVTFKDGTVQHVIEVDVQLVLAADQSASVSRLMTIKQRRGFAAAFRDENLQRTVGAGPRGRIAVIYFEWSDDDSQHIAVPWTLLEDSADMIQFADALDDLELGPVGGETSIGGAMQFAGHLLETNRFTSFRKVVDISANGRNNVGPPMQDALQSLIAEGAVVNGLILPETPVEQDGSLVNYFRRKVIGGFGAFAIEITPERGFSDAILRKLIQEVAWNG